MKRFLTRHVHERRRIRLMAAGALPEAERRQVDRHLATCEACRQYQESVTRAAAPLAHWQENIAHTEVSEAVRKRWARRIEGARRAGSLRRFPPVRLCFSVWRELLWPARRVWAGFALVWMAIVLINMTAFNSPEIIEARRHPLPRSTFEAWQRQQRLMSKLLASSQEAWPQPSRGASGKAGSNF